MKTLVVFVMFLFTFLGMGSQASANFSQNPPDTLHFENEAEDNDSIEYELIILDPGFDFWFNTNKKGEWFYSEEYLEHWNQILVSQWNNQIGLRGRGDCSPDMYIDYNPSIDYGKTLNYKLFYYFRYVDEECRLFTNSPSRWR